VTNDEDATILDFSNSTELASALNFNGAQPFQGNEKNGTPWFRMKNPSGRGVASHPHFDGLAASGHFEADVLAAHNIVREYAGIGPLQWSRDLEQMAVARVHKLANEGCYIKHSPMKSRRSVNDFFYVGENLYKVINMDPTGVDIVDAWYAEIEDYTFGRVGKSCVRQRCDHRKSPPCTIGHFTQVMWHDSKHLGCAMAECPDQDKHTFVAVCNYGEGGNKADTLPFWPAQAAKLGLGDAECPVVHVPEPAHVVEKSTEAKHKSDSVGRSPFFAFVFAGLGVFFVSL